MEIANICIILFSTIICVIWALRKKREIETFKISIHDENLPLNEQNKENVLREEEDLEYISSLFQETIMEIMKKVLIISFIIFFIMSILVWLLLEEKLEQFLQGILFFFGGFSQILLGHFIFKKHKMFDPRIITFCRINKWVCLDHIIKLNSFITLMNQALNLVMFGIVYYSATCICIYLEYEEMTEKNFERFHRRFLSYGFGSVFAYFLIKSLSNLFSNASGMVCEILASQNSEGIEEDHAKNPAKILNNISESHFRIFQNSLQYNALTNMGLCIYQDFFVTRSVYLLDRGFLDAIAILSLGLIGTLISMLIFRNLNKFKMSEGNEFNIRFSKMKKNGLIAIFLSLLFSSAGAVMVIKLTFPDSIAVYDPFKQKIQLKNLDSDDSLFMFLISSLIIFTLVINSLFFTVQNSSVMKKMLNSTKIGFSLTLVSAEKFACFACILPMGIFFLVLYLNYAKGNIYGIAMECLGIITYFQIIQFFQNFKNIYFFFKSLIMARNIDDENAISNFNDIISTCRMFGKFSNGVSQFITIIVSFVILLDNFNIQIVDTIIVIEPFYLLGICSGVLIFYLLNGLDIRCDAVFTQKFLRLIKNQCLKRINDEDYEPPVAFLGSQLVTFGYNYQLFAYICPVVVTLWTVFSLFGKKMIVIVLFGAFVYILLTCYHTLIKSELLLDIKDIFTEPIHINRINATNPKIIARLANYVGTNYKSYTADNYIKLLLLFCSMLMCSEYFIDSTGILATIHGMIVNTA
jgi:Na+/H+-translocating membrane pyrophosphatase